MCDAILDFRFLESLDFSAARANAEQINFDFSARKTARTIRYCRALDQNIECLVCHFMLRNQFLFRYIFPFACTHVIMQSNWPSLLLL